MILELLLNVQIYNTTYKFSLYDFSYYFYYSYFSNPAMLRSCNATMIKHLTIVALHHYTITPLHHCSFAASAQLPLVRFIRPALDGRTSCSIAPLVANISNILNITPLQHYSIVALYHCSIN